jgi:pimeloyl-ACP methyl ester carboxylesterase
VTGLELAPGLSVRVVGGSDRPAVLWIHGYTIDSGVWSGLWDRLPGWRHVGIDLPGHGRSRPLGTDEHLPDLGRLVADGARAMGVEHVVGLSLGTIVALQVVLSAPTAFRSLTLGAPALGGGPTDEAAGRRYRELARMCRDLGPGPWMTALWTQSPPHIFTWAKRDPALWAVLCASIGRHTWQDLRTGVPVTRLARDVQPLSALADLELATLVLVGEHEMDAFKETAGILAAHMPNARVTTVDGTGHLCLLEASERCADLIEHHLVAAAAGRR